MYKSIILIIIIAISVSFSQMPDVNIFHNNKLELLAVLSYYAMDSVDRENYLFTDSNAFLNNVTAYFDSFSGHRAIKMYSSMLDKGLTIEKACFVLFHYNDLPEMELEYPIENVEGFIDGMSEKKTIKELKKWIEEVRYFSQETSFFEFLNNNLEVIFPSLTNAIHYIESNGILPKIALFYRLDEKDIKIYFSMIFKGGFSFISPEGSYCSVYGPVSSDGQIVQFIDDSLAQRVKLNISEIIVDSFVNVYKSNIIPSKILYNTLGDEAKIECSEWICAVKKQIIYASLSNLSEDNIEDMIHLIDKTEKGYIYTPFISQIMSEIKMKAKSFNDIVNNITMHINGISINNPMIQRYIKQGLRNDANKKKYKEKILKALEKYGVRKEMKEYLNRELEILWRTALGDCNEIKYETMIKIINLKSINDYSNSIPIIECMLSDSSGKGIKYWQAKLLIAEIYIKENNLDKAAIEAKSVELAEIDNNVTANAIWILGRIAEHKGDKIMAKQYYQKALEVLPEYPEVKKSLSVLEDKGL